MTNKVVVVAGGTGNIGTFIVRALLERGATVVVPSRSAERLSAWRDHIARFADVRRLHGVVGNIADEKSGAALLERIRSEVGSPDAAIASLGTFRFAPSLLDVSVADLQAVLDDYLMAHFAVAKLFLEPFRTSGGDYVFINGPLAFSPWDGTGLVSIATAAQQLLFQSLAKELTGTGANVIELVNYAFIRDRETQPSSTLSGEEVGAYVAHLVYDAAYALHGRSVHLDSPQVLAAAGIEEVART